MDLTRIAYLFQDFIETNVETFRNGNEQVARQEGRFLNNLVKTFPKISGLVIENYTRILTEDSTWISKLNHQFIVTWMARYFSEHNSYEIFNIIQHVLTSDQFITQSQYDRLIEFTNGDQAVRYVYTYLINKQLSAIYSVWKTDTKYCKDARIIRSKLLEIHNSHSIPSNFPDIQQIASDTSLVEPDQTWCVLLQKPVLSDNFIAHLKIWRYLKDYLVMLSGMII